MKRLVVRGGLVFVLAVGSVHAQVPAARTSRAVPTPTQVMGFAPGTERKLADFAHVSSYFKALAEASPHVRLFTIGESTDGRDMILAAISSEENLRRLDRFKDIARLRLAVPRPAARHVHIPVQSDSRKCGRWGRHFFYSRAIDTP